jgi:hypothetical protein
VLELTPNLSARLKLADAPTVNGPLAVTTDAFALFKCNTSTSANAVAAGKL